MNKQRTTLRATASFWNSSLEEREEICNGIGPAGWPEGLRNLFNKPWLTYGVSFVPAADIHDWDYAKGTTKEDKRIADKRFYHNCKVLVYKHTSWWKILLLLKRLERAKEFYLAVKFGGKKAYWAGKIKQGQIDVF